MVTDVRGGRGQTARGLAGVRPEGVHGLRGNPSGLRVVEGHHDKEEQKDRERGAETRKGAAEAAAAAVTTI